MAKNNEEKGTENMAVNKEKTTVNEPSVYEAINNHEYKGIPVLNSRCIAADAPQKISFSTNPTSTHKRTLQFYLDQIGQIVFTPIPVCVAKSSQ